MGWKVKRLGDVCTIRPPKQEARAVLDGDSEVSFLPMPDMGIRQRSVTPAQGRRLAEVYKGYTYFANGDLLLAKITPCFQNGKLGIARNLINGIGFGSTEFFVLRCDDCLDPDYLFYFLSRDTFLQEGVARMGGAVGQQRVPPEFLAELQTPLPPLSEQKRIVAILDEAFDAIDTATAHAEKNLANARDLFRSHVNAVFAVDGSGWEKRPLGDICENLDSRRVPVTKRDRKPGHIPYYGASGVVDYVEDYLFDEDLLLVSEDGANLLARTYPIAFSISGKTWVNNHAHVLRFDRMCSQRFVEYYLNSVTIAPWVSGMAQPKLNQKALNSIAVPFPTVDVQEEVVTTCDILYQESQELCALYERKLKALAGLKQSILHKAFTGELTSDSKGASRELVAI